MPIPKGGGGSGEKSGVHASAKGFGWVLLLLCILIALFPIFAAVLVFSRPWRVRTTTRFSASPSAFICECFAACPSFYLLWAIPIFLQVF
jgi:hypothetical protein